MLSDQQMTYLFDQLSATNYDRWIFCVGILILVVRYCILLFQ